MKQLIQNFKTGELKVENLPIPAVNDKQVLVENAYSLISAGTERGTVKVGKASMLGKAKQRPDLVKQVMQNLQKEGVKATIEKVTTKLDSLKALGYSTAGIVRVSMDSGAMFKTGDRVACAGQDYASHAEIVSIPQNLVAKIPDNVTFKEAAFTTLGAIALQGIRQANPKLGDNVCVIGLGLLGNITGQLLKANGCNVFGVDVSKKIVEDAKKLACHSALVTGDSNLMAEVNDFTNGNGFDSVIITAATTSNDPIELSAQILRKKGAVIVVGAVNMEIPRNPDFYRKELELKMSCSYGPGRYDVNYEEEGNDYPIGYVRWTEQRNMEAFLGLLSKKVINLKPLITHVFDIEEADKAYDLVLGKTEEHFIGILLKYDFKEDETPHLINISSNPVCDVNVGFIGAGSFAQSYLIPNVKKAASLDTVVTSTGMSCKNTASKFGFNNASTESDDVLKNPEINTVFIATRHDSHAHYVVESLKAGKNVYVEKPIAMNQEELNEVVEAYSNYPGRLFVGYNRRFSPAAVEAKKQFESLSEPVVMNFTVNAGFIPKEHWTQCAAGGGRIVGEICHFIDLMQFFTDSEPVKVYAECIDSNSSKIKNDDNIIINIKFKNGAVGNLIYYANGDKAMQKERIEIIGGGKIFCINNFRDAVLYNNNKTRKLKLSGKGHEQEVTSFINSINEGTASPISFESLKLTSRTTFKIVDSLYTGFPQKI